jgi:DNA-3-methyladenine glycosylase II
VARGGEPHVAHATREENDMTPDYWVGASAALSKRCKVMRRLVKAYPEATLRTRGDPFQTLARAIVGQQISVKAAQSVWDRTVALVGKMKPAHVLAVTPEQLREAGNSRQKIAYMQDLAAHFVDGRIKPRRWHHMDDDSVIAELTTVKGIGRWTAEMFLIFHLMRPNVFPVNDIGLIRAIEKHFHGGERLDKAEVEAYRARWAPWNTVATWYLWRSLDPIPVEY